MSAHVSRIAGRAAIARPGFSPSVVRGLMLAVLCGALTAGFVATGVHDQAAALQRVGAALTRLMRFMAVLKMAMVLCAAAVVVWRLGTAISAARFGAYALACAAMAAGPGLIWGMAHVALGAVLLHGGLFAVILLLWLDPAVANRLGEMVAAKRGRVTV